MTDFITPADMVETYGKSTIRDLTDRTEPPAGAIDYTRLQTAINAALELAIGYINKKYTIPLETDPIGVIPVDLKKHCMSLAFYNLLISNPNMITEGTRLAYEDAKSWLKAVSVGDILLPIATSQSGAGMVRAVRYAASFSDSNLQGF